MIPIRAKLDSLQTLSRHATKYGLDSPPLLATKDQISNALDILSARFVEFDPGPRERDRWHVTLKDTPSAILYTVTMGFVNVPAHVRKIDSNLFFWECGRILRKQKEDESKKQALSLLGTGYDTEAPDT